MLTRCGLSTLKLHGINYISAAGPDNSDHLAGCKGTEEWKGRENKGRGKERKEENGRNGERKERDEKCARHILDGVLTQRFASGVNSFIILLVTAQ